MIPEKIVWQNQLSSVIKFIKIYYNNYGKGYIKYNFKNTVYAQRTTSNTMFVSSKEHQINDSWQMKQRKRLVGEYLILLLFFILVSEE